MRPAALRWIRFYAGLGITAACLWLTLRRVHFDEMARAARHLQWLWLVVALLALAAGYSARIHRWWWMLRTYSPSVQLRSCVWPLLAGFAVNNVVPFRAGDALRIVGFCKELNTPAVRLLGSLLIERILDLSVLLIFLLVGMADLGAQQLPAGYLRIAVLVTVVGAGGWTCLLWMGDHLESLLLKICRVRIWGDALGAKVAQHVQHLFAALSLVRVPGAALKLLAMSGVVWSCEGGVFAAIAAGLGYGGRGVGPWFALATGSLATMIPSSPGYVGTFDLFTLSGFAAYGVATASAVAMTLVIHLLLWLPITAAGLGYLLVVHFREPNEAVMAGAAQKRKSL